MENERPMVGIRRARRFTLSEKANLRFVDVVELEDGEVWTRSLRRPGHEDPVTGDPLVWRPVPYQGYDKAVAGRREFEWDIKHLVEDHEIAAGGSREPGPTLRERRS